jgi:Branched-chain amino acid transport protein (AzlD)
MSLATSDLWPYLALILAGFLPNEVWRWLGVWLGRGLDEESEVIVWVRGVATAVLVGVVVKLAVFPSGALAEVPLAVRIGALALGFAAFWFARRSVFAGVIAGEIVLIGGAIWQFHLG